MDGISCCPRAHDEPISNKCIYYAIAKECPFAPEGCKYIPCKYQYPQTRVQNNNIQNQFQYNNKYDIRNEHNNQANVPNFNINKRKINYQDPQQLYINNYDRITSIAIKHIEPQQQNNHNDTYEQRWNKIDKYMKGLTQTIQKVQNEMNQMKQENKMLRERLSKYEI
eukprot:97041_1